MSNKDNELEISEAVLDNLIDIFNKDEGEVLAYKNDLNAIKNRLDNLDVSYKNVLFDFISYLLDVNSKEEYNEKSILKDQYKFSNELHDKEMVNSFNNFIYEDLVKRVTEVSKMVNETSDEELNDIIITIFKNLEDSGNKHMSYQDEIRSISKKLYERLNSEKETAVNNDYMVKYISPILIPASRRDIDTINFSNQLDGEELEMFLQDVIEQSNELLDYYDEIKNRTEGLITYFNELTFREKDNLTVKHLNTINSFIARNQNLFEPQVIISFDKLTNEYEELKSKSKKKHLKEFLNIYTVIVLQTTIDLETSFEELPEKQEVNYINYFEKKLRDNELV